MDQEMKGKPCTEEKSTISVDCDYLRHLHVFLLTVHVLDKLRLGMQVPMINVKAHVLAAVRLMESHGCGYKGYRQVGRFVA